MTDDIVTRLRQGGPICIDGHIYREWANEAADEIERLREQVAEYQNLYLLRSRLGDAIGGAW